MLNIKTILLSCGLLIFLILFETLPSEVINSVKLSISLWRDNLIPSLFPFLVLSFLLNFYEISNLLSIFLLPLTRFLHIPSNCGFIILLSMLSGFPANAKFINEALDEKRITINDASYLLKFCFFPSSLFVIASVGELFLGNKTLGFLLLITHYIASFIIAILFRSKQNVIREQISFKKCLNNIRERMQESNFIKVLKSAIFSSLETLVLLFGIITCFLVITNLLFKVISLNELSKTVLSGVFELTQGVKNVSLTRLNTYKKCLIISSFLAFGGLSIHAQIFSVLSKYHLSYFNFFIFRIIHILLSITVFILLTNIFV